MSKLIVLEFDGKYGQYEINEHWYDLNIPGHLISNYVPKAKTTAKYIKFKPTGKLARLKDGKKCELWKGQPS